MNKELAIDMLAAVKKPARYTGGEFGSIFKEEAEVRIALAFPDVYEGKPKRLFVNVTW